MNKFLFILLLIFNIAVANAQNKGKLSYKWSKPEPFVTIPGLFKNEDAVAIYNRRGVKNDFEIVQRGIKYHTSAYMKRKIRILTANGLKEYSNIYIRKIGSYTVSTLDARTIKKDGKTISIKPDDIKLLRSYDDDEDVYYDEYKIAIPGAEIGDEIEYIYTYYSDGISMADDVYLHADIACLESTFELTVKKGIIMDTYAINDMVAPVITDDNIMQTLSWSLIMLPSVKNQNYEIADKEFPYIQYKAAKISLHEFNFEDDLSIENWGQLYKTLAHEENDRQGKSRGLEKYFTAFKSTLDTMKNIEKVSFFVKNINENFTILDNEDEENALRPVMYFIDNKKIDRIDLKLFYKYMFYYLNIPYETCFGKSRYVGDLFPEIISRHQITHVFYSFLDEQQGKHYLFTSFSDFTFNVDERPYAYEDTKVIYLKKNDPFSNDKPTYNIQKMGHLPAEINVRSVSCAYTISPDWSSALCDVKLTYTGMLSLRYRMEWLNDLKDYKNNKWLEMMHQEENKLYELDTVLVLQNDKDAPYKFGVRIKSNEKEIISPSGDNISSLKVQIPFGHNIIPSYSYMRITDLYMPYLYNDELVYFVQFPSAVTIINEKDLIKNISTEAGSFSLNIVKISDTVYKISSVYKIKTSMLPKGKYKSLVDLNEMVDQTKELNVLYKKL